MPDSKAKVLRIGTLFNSNQGGAVYDIDGLAPNICAAFHGYANGYIVVKRKGDKICPASEKRDGNGYKP